MTNASEPSKRTLASSVYDELRTDIQDGSLLPKSKLNIRILSERFGVGLSPVREALSRLSSEGLVQQTDHRGFVVRAIDVDELWDLYQARCWLNEIAVRESIKHGDNEWEEKVVLAFHRLSRVARQETDLTRTNTGKWDIVHRAFHTSILAACQSQWMISLCDQTFLVGERFRHVARQLGHFRPSEVDDHPAIMEAVIDRRADDAVELLKAHFRHTTERVEEALRNVAPARPLNGEAE